MASGVSRTSREDHKAKQALDEARKAGTALPEVDEDGNDINPHIPQYIVSAPWYLKNSSAPGLKHQRLRESDIDKGTSLDVWYKRGEKGQRHTRWKAGACQNCGAMTHDTKDCFERPRKVAAKFTNKNLAADDVVVNLELDYDAKRDRWNGYDPSLHITQMERYQVYEDERKKEKQKELAQAGAEKAEKEGESSDDDSEEIDEYEDVRETDAANSILTAKRETATCTVRTTIRNLRIREDTAKYLINLDVNSAFFDPKTRSMREDPLKGIEKGDDRLYRGDNYVRASGQVGEFNKLQVFAWEAENQGQGVNPLALPSQAEYMFQQFAEKKGKLKQETQSELLAKYGGEEYLETIPKPLLLGQSENYVEYSQTGKVIKGQEKAIPKSKYDEDIFPQNHTSVWGSYWSNGKWGYACCHQTSRNCFCLGTSIEKVRENLQQTPPKTEVEEEERKQETISNSPIITTPIKTSKKNGKGKEKDKEKDLSEELLQKAIEREEWIKNHPEEKDERKRKYNSLAGSNVDVTEEEMEAYRMKRRNWEDPLNTMS